MGRKRDTPQLAAGKGGKRTLAAVADRQVVADCGPSSELFWFVGAVIAGFRLTAIPNRTKNCIIVLDCLSA